MRRPHDRSGSLWNPWLFRDAQALLARKASTTSHPTPPSGSEWRCSTPVSRSGFRATSRKTVIEFRKHFGWYTKGLHVPSDLRARLFQVETMAEAEEIFASYLGPIAQVA
jgi:tRNA-dihydrouridine synthase